MAKLSVLKSTYDKIIFFPQYKYHLIYIHFSLVVFTPFLMHMSLSYMHMVTSHYTIWLNSF